MNPTRRFTVALAAAACLLAAGCGTPAEKQHAGGKSNYRQALAFSKCMRAHGDPAWPDPGPEGAFPNDNGSLDKSSPQFKKARATCRKLEPGSPDAASFQRDYKKLLKYSACMRRNGITKYPDPKLDQHGVGISVDGHEVDVKSPQYARAARACRSLQPGGQG